MTLLTKCHRHSLHVICRGLLVLPAYKFSRGPAHPTAWLRRHSDVDWVMGVWFNPKKCYVMHVRRAKTYTMLHFCAVLLPTPIIWESASQRISAREWRLKLPVRRLTSGCISSSKISRAPHNVQESWHWTISPVSGTPPQSRFNKLEPVLCSTNAGGTAQLVPPQCSGSWASLIWQSRGGK